MSYSKVRLLGRPLNSCKLLQLVWQETVNSRFSATVSAIVPDVKTVASPPLILEQQREQCMEKLRNLPAFPRPKSQQYNTTSKSPASVLIPLCLERDTNEISLLYTRRSRHLRSHSLQISFPGGKRDDTDGSFTDCALRETAEEIGLAKDRIEIWGEGNSMDLPRTSIIVPVVGEIKDFHISELKINHDEVEEAFSIPIKALITPENIRHTQFRGGFSSPVFLVDHHRIWGITGYLTYVFLRCLLPSTMLPNVLKKNPKYIQPYNVKQKLYPVLVPSLPYRHVEPTPTTPTTSTTSTSTSIDVEKD